MRIVTNGTHVFGSVNGCPRELLEKVNIVKDIMLKTVSETKLNQVGETFHQFKPFGVTGVILLAESHISIHTWPEKGYAAIDVFTCGKEGNASDAFDVLSRLLKAKEIDKQIVNR